MEIIKSDRISILPIINKNKLMRLNSYINNIKDEKNRIATLSLKDTFFQDLLFKKDKTLSSYYINYKAYYFTGWEFQKFFNQDLLDKEINRIEQWLFSKTPYSTYKNNIYSIIKCMIRMKAYEFTHNQKSLAKEKEK